MGWRFCPLSENLDIFRSGFNCGDEEINAYFRESAQVSEELNFSKVFLMVPESHQNEVAGFYTLSNSSIPPKELSDEFMEGFRFPCPAVLIGQFAIDKKYQNQKLSRQLLWDAYRRIILLSKSIAFRAIRVDTRTDEAKAFWMKQGFLEFQKTKRSLFLPLKTLIRELKDI